MSKLDDWEREAQELKLSTDLPPVTFFQRNRILALIELIRKKDEALRFYGHEHDFTKRSDYGIRAREALGSELE